MTKPIKVVLDTNAVLSALLFNQSSLAWLRIEWQSGKLQPLASKATIAELIKTLNYPKFKLTNVEQQDLLADYLPYVSTVGQVKSLKAKNVCRDLHNVIFLELSLTGSAQYLVTGDKDLLEFKAQFGFEIITPQQLKRLLDLQPN